MGLAALGRLCFGLFWGLVGLTSLGCLGLISGFTPLGVVVALFMAWLLKAGLFGLGFGFGFLTLGFVWAWSRVTLF